MRIRLPMFRSQYVVSVHRQPITSDAVSYPSRTESSQTAMRTPQNSQSNPILQIRWTFYPNDWSRSDMSLTSFNPIGIRIARVTKFLTEITTL